MIGGFRIFDSHTHLGQARHSGRTYSADALLRDMDARGVDRSVVIPFPVVEDFRALTDRAAPTREAVAAKPALLRLLDSAGVVDLVARRHHVVAVQRAWRQAEAP